MDAEGACLIDPAACDGGSTCPTPGPRERPPLALGLVAAESKAAIGRWNDVSADLVDVCPDI